MQSLPHLTADVPPIDAQFRAELEDFAVEEIPAYPPSGSGDHVFALIEKRDLTTRQALRRLCTEVGADLADAGWAGLKDKRGVTRQWVSLFRVDPEAVRRIAAPDLRVLDAVRHDRKLRTGHLRGNRFHVRLRGIDAPGIGRLRTVLDRIQEKGLPNYYGEQRFGRRGDNAVRALRWVRGETRPPRKAFNRKLEMSALQAELFNRHVAALVDDQALGRVFEGGLVKKHDSGGVFVVEDVSEAQSRADRFELSATGPIFGAKMRWPRGPSKDREEALLEDAGLTRSDFARWKRVAPGTRRSVRVLVPEIAVSVSGDTVELDFTLPAGSYATILVREIRKRGAFPPDPG